MPSVWGNMAKTGIMQLPVMNGYLNVGMVLFLMWTTRISCDPKSETTDYIEEASQVYSTIFHKYNDRVRPATRYPSPVKINADITIAHVREFDLERQELETVVDVVLRWIDGRLPWYGYNVKHITVNETTVWSPDVTFMNSVSGHTAIKSPRLVIKQTGQITWKRRLRIRTLCPTNLTADTQTCSLLLRSDVYVGEEQMFQDVKVMVDENFHNHKWAIKNISKTVDFQNVTTDDTTFVFSYAQCDITLEAKQDNDGMKNGETARLAQSQQQSGSVGLHVNRDHVRLIFLVTLVFLFLN